MTAKADQRRDAVAHATETALLLEFLTWLAPRDTLTDRDRRALVMAFLLTTGRSDSTTEEHSRA
jgi:hypothetical protein